MNARRPSEMPRRGSVLRLPLAASTFVGGIALLVLAACGFNTHGAGMGGNGGGGGAVPCNVSSQCDDHNPCTTDTCGPDKTCLFAPLDGVPSPVQTAGDCKTVQCVKGEPVSKPDDADVPDDHKPCTIDSCNLGTPSHVPEPLDTPCIKDGSSGQCDMQGVCQVRCTTVAQCMSTNPCVTPSCDVSTGLCVFTNLDSVPTPGVTDVVGDCKVPVCVAGTATLANDDSDVPKTPTDCDTEVCINGTPKNPPVPIDTPCFTFLGTMKGFCNGVDPGPACVQCASDADCPGTADDCHHPACVNFACTTAFTPLDMPAAGTTNPPQVAGDCQRLVCDGMGGVVDVYDAADPKSDGNPCTTDTCTAPNMTTHSSVTDGTHCGTGGALACVGGSCTGCTSDGMCTPDSCAGTVLTKAQTCNGVGVCVSAPTQDCAPYLCSVGTNACTSTCNADTDCAQAGTGNYCTGVGGACLPREPHGGACTGAHQCQSNSCVDGFCCDTACNTACYACSAARTGGLDGTCGAVTNGTDPNNDCADQGAPSCGKTGLCDNGACALYASGTICVAASCMGNATVSSAHTCNGSGTCVPPVPLTLSCAPYLCSAGTSACSKSCALDTDCSQAGTGSYCASMVCTPKVGMGAPCASTNACQGSLTCVDGVCCSSACSSPCMACAAALKQSGSDGTCGPTKDGMADPHGLCPMQSPLVCGNTGLCQSGACAKVAAGTVCRPVAGACDLAESCDGVGSCPADTFVTLGTVCRPSAGLCDVAESCTGMAAACPADAFVTLGTVCRPSAGLCDVAESCTGVSAACPADALVPSGTVCRPAAGPCDAPESCTGMSTACPADAFLTSSAVCRLAMGLCDVAENCTGTGITCPADAVQAAGTVCGAMTCSGSTQATHTCDGTTKSCGSTSTSCGRYNCAATSCKTTCATSADCSTTFCAGDHLCCAVSCGPCGTCAGGTTCNTVAVKGSTAGCTAIGAGFLCDGNGTAAADCRKNDHTDGAVCSSSADCAMSMNNTCTNNVCN